MSHLIQDQDFAAGVAACLKKRVECGLLRLRKFMEQVRESS